MARDDLGWLDRGPKIGLFFHSFALLLQWEFSGLLFGNGRLLR